MTTRLMLVRHAACAQTENMLLGRTIDAPLDARGERQANALAERLREFDPALIEASPRLRAQQTARAIAQRAGSGMRTVEALDELDFGDWSGRSFDQLADDPAWQRWNRIRGSARTPAGDTMASLQVRVLRHLGELMRALAGETIVLVTHAETIRSVLLHLLSMPADRYGRIEIGLASMTTLRATTQGIFVDAIDERVEA